MGKGAVYIRIASANLPPQSWEPAPICQSQTQTQTPICERNAAPIWNAPHNCAQISSTVATAQVARCSRRTLQAPLWKPGRPLLLPQHLYAAVCANHGPHRHESDTRPGQPEKRAHGAGSPRHPRREQESPTLAAGRVGAVPRCVGAELPSDYIAELLCSVERTCYSVYGDYAAELHARNCLTARPQTTCDSPRGLGCRRRKRARPQERRHRQPRRARGNCGGSQAQTGRQC